MPSNAGYTRIDGQGNKTVFSYLLVAATARSPSGGGSLAWVRWRGVSSDDDADDADDTGSRSD